VEALVRAASRRPSEVEGLVRVTASEVIAAEVLPHILKDGYDRHPKLQFEVEGSNRTADLLQRGADIAVRMAAPLQQSLLVAKIGQVELGLYATPDYIARRGRLDRLEDLQKHRLIGFATETPYVRALAAGLPMPARDDFAFRTDSDLSAIGALRAGLGVGFCQCGIARREGWERLLPDAFVLRLPTWVVMHEDLKASPACRAAFDLLVEGMRRYVASQAGDTHQMAVPRSLI